VGAELRIVQTRWLSAIRSWRLGPWSREASRGARRGQPPAGSPAMHPGCSCRASRPEGVVVAMSEVREIENEHSSSTFSARGCGMRDASTA
jgi:hypothetical protein